MAQPNSTTKARKMSLTFTRGMTAETAAWRDAMQDEQPTAQWSDQELVDYARPYARERGLPVVHVPLVATLTDDAPDTAEVRFDGRAPGPQITVRRYRR